MAKWLKDYLNFGARRDPPQPPRPDYSESEILKAYRAQKELDFEDPYQHSDKKEHNGFSPCSGTVSLPSFPDFSALQVKVLSPKHRLIKVDSQEFDCKLPVSLQTEPVVIPSAPAASDSDTDYSDPFDVRPGPRTRGWEPKPAATESCSYMEPFQAQRIISELSLMSSRASGADGAQLYDNPYEEKSRLLHRAGGAGGAGGGAAPPPAPPPAAAPPREEEEGRESRLPQDDERPADEYDQPWEWKKDDISKALAVQFEGAVRDRSRAQPESSRFKGPPSSPGGPGEAPTLRLVGDTPPLLGERVDPFTPLHRQVWYHGALSRSEAESLLTLCKESSYLVRNSQTCRNDFSLSLRSCQGFMHMKFTRCGDGRFVLGENSPPFCSVPEVVHYYTTHKLPIRGAEHMSLLYPVIVQTL